MASDIITASVTSESSMSSPSTATTKLIVVLGATGNQGGSVVTQFLNEPGWKVRAITRNASSTKAQALLARGAEIVAANMNDPSTLKAAFQNAAVIFAVTDFMGNYLDPQLDTSSQPGVARNVVAGQVEQQQLQNVIDAAAKVPGLERLIVSSLSDAVKWSKGKFKLVEHFNCKARAVEYGKETYPDLWAKTSVIQVGWFLTNFLGPAMGPKMTSEGVVRFTSFIDPDARLPIAAPEEDTGPFVKALVEGQPGRSLIAYREYLSSRELAKAFTEGTTKPSEIVFQRFREAKTPFPGDFVDEMEEQFLYWAEFGYEGWNDSTLVHPHQLESPPKLESVVDWMKKQDWSFIG